VVPRRTLLSANEAEPAVDDYTLIYDLDEAPARQLVEQWPSLPDAVQVSSEEGEQLLSAARDGAGWHEQGASERQEQAPRRLYDQHGDGIRDASRLNAVLDDADDAVWLVPAMALTRIRSGGRIRLIVRCRWYLRVRISIVKPVDGRPTTSSRSTSRSRAAWWTGPTDLGVPGVWFGSLRTQSRVAPVLGVD